MNDPDPGEGIAIPQSVATDRGEQAVLDAEQLTLALTAVAATRPELSHEASKHAERLRFATNRLRELRWQASVIGGVFAPARAEVALSILEGQVALTAGFINRTMKSLRRKPGRREQRAVAAEALATMDDLGPSEAAA